MIQSDEHELPKNQVTELSLYEWRSKTLTISLIIVIVASLPAYASVFINAIQNSHLTWREYLYLGVYVGLIGLAFLPRLDLKTRAWVLMFITYSNAAASFMRLGLVGSGRLWLLILPVIATIIIGAKAGYFTAAISIAMYATFTFLMDAGILEQWIVLGENPLSLGYWLEGGAALVVYIATLVVLVERFSDLQMRSFSEAQQSNIHLGEMTRALSESERRFRLFMDHFPGLAYIKDFNSRVIFANQGFLTYLNIDPSQIIGKENHEIFPADFAEKITEDDQRILLADQSNEIEEVFGGRTWATFKFPIHQGDNFPLLGGLTLDVTERKNAEAKIQWLNEDLERRVFERTMQLENTNKEMEAFTYTVSHDLRAPLRAISGFVNILVEDYAKDLDTEGQGVCKVIEDETHHMNQLIDDLLALSRLNRADMQLMTIDMKAMAYTVFSELAAQNDLERIEFDLGNIPMGVGDPGLIRQVWVNLLENSLKFSSKKEKAIISVKGKKEASEVIYSIHDNGAGFEMEYADKLFNVFQRLHREKEFPGTGVGLTIVYRIIQRHGGRVWAESVVDNGATFYFSLPIDTI